MPNLHKNLETQLRHAFLDALIAGSRDPLDRLRHELKFKIKQYEKPSYPETSLDEALKNPNIDMREASELLTLSKQATPKALTASLNEHPDRDRIITTLKQARKIAKELNIGHAGYSPKESAKYTLHSTLITAAAATFLPFIVDLASNFNDVSSGPYILAALCGAVWGATNSARIQNNEFYRYQKTGLKHIQKSIKPS